MCIRFGYTELAPSNFCIRFGYRNFSVRNFVSVLDTEFFLFENLYPTWIQDSKQYARV